MEERFQVGVISSTHGVKGEVKVYPTTDDPKRFQQCKKVIAVGEKTESLLEIQGVKFIKKMVILKLKGYDTMNDAETLRGIPLFVDRKDAVPLEENEYFIADLLDLDVVNEMGEIVGKLTDVIETGANDVYEIELKDKTKVLLPAIKDCVREINIEENKMTVFFMPGILPEGKDVEVL